MPNIVSKVDIGIREIVRYKKEEFIFENNTVTYFQMVTSPGQASIRTIVFTCMLIISYSLRYTEYSFISVISIIN